MRVVCNVLGTMRNVESESTRICEMDRPKITTLLKHRQSRGASRREKMAPKIGREAPRDDDFSIIAKKHFFNNFQHFLNIFLTFFKHFSTCFQHIFTRGIMLKIFFIFSTYIVASRGATRRPKGPLKSVARRHATTQRTPQIGRESTRDGPKKMMKKSMFN